MGITPVLIATPGAWGPTGVALTYQWMANRTAIPGATGKTLKLAAAQSGTSITVAVTGTSVGNTTIGFTEYATFTATPATVTNCSS